MSTPLHPPISEVSIISRPDIEGEYLINMAGVVRLAKEADTPQGRRLYRLYCAEYRALEGSPLSHEKREETAMLAAMKRFGMNLVSLPGDDAG